MRLGPPAWLTIALLSSLCGAYGLSLSQRQDLAEEVRELFIQGYEGYMRYAYPADELKPVTCQPLLRDPDPGNFGINDVHSNTSLTLLDVLSSLPYIHPSGFANALQLVTTEISFDQDVKVQVFEMTIRALGSLLSTYQYLEGLPQVEEPKAKAKTKASTAPQSGGGAGAAWGWKKKKRKEPAPAGVESDLRTYMPRILEMAHDLGKRLLPAFDTATGIPYARVNLRSGVESGETVETCTAGAGSLVLEFTVLSRLTGDERFEVLARRAFMALYKRRSPHGLVGNNIGATHGLWLAPGFSGVGAGIDSYYEYGMKAAILLDDDEYLDVFNDLYAAVQTHVRTPDGFIYRPVQLRSLTPSSPSTIDSLSAFLPGLQVLAGDISSAIKSHLVFWNLWRRYSALPESYLWEERELQWAGYPGRPEFIESTYYLWKATGDEFYLRVGERILQDLRSRLKTECGFATLRNVETGEFEDRMESFVLSETLKYLYLLFDTSPSGGLTNKVFTTEGHLLSLPHSKVKAQRLGDRVKSTSASLRKGENQKCPRYKPPTRGGLVVGIEQRDDWEYARSLVYGWGFNGRVEEDGRVFWSEDGWCAIPKVPRWSFDVVLTPLNSSSRNPDDSRTPDGKSASTANDSPTGTHGARDKVFQNEKGEWIVNDVKDIRFEVRWRLDGTGYDISKVGNTTIYPGQSVLITDPSMDGYLPLSVPSPSSENHPPPAAGSQREPSQVVLRFSKRVKPTSGGGLTSQQKDDMDVESAPQGQEVFLHAIGGTATFGASFRPVPKVKDRYPDEDLPFKIGSRGVALLRPQRSNIDGCSQFLPGHNLISQLQSNSEFELGIENGGTNRPFVLLLNRGNCAFIQKMSHAAELEGCVGVIVMDTPPSPSPFSSYGQGSGAEEPEIRGEAPGTGGEEPSDGGQGQGQGQGLIRPSADGEEERLIARVERAGLGMVHVEEVVGRVLRDVFHPPTLESSALQEHEQELEGKFPGSDQEQELGLEVEVEVLDVSMLGLEDEPPLRGPGASASTSTFPPPGERKTARREGRVAVGEWGIWNLVIVEG